MHAHHHHGDDHHHDHDGHEHGPLEQITHVHGGPLLLDIGGEIGAMVVLTDHSRLGTELFLRRQSDGVEIHTGVWQRQIGADHIVAAVFCELIEGTYDLLDVQRIEHVEVRGGHVADVDLRTHAHERDAGVSDHGPVPMIAHTNPVFGGSAR